MLWSLRETLHIVCHVLWGVWTACRSLNAAALQNVFHMWTDSASQYQYRIMILALPRAGSSWVSLLRLQWASYHVLVRSLYNQVSSKSSIVYKAWKEFPCRCLNRRDRCGFLNSGVGRKTIIRCLWPQNQMQEGYSVPVRLIARVVILPWRSRIAHSSKLNTCSSIVTFIIRFPVSRYSTDCQLHVSIDKFVIRLLTSHHICP